MLDLPRNLRRSAAKYLQLSLLPLMNKRCSYKINNTVSSSKRNVHLKVAVFLLRKFLRKIKRAEALTIAR